MPKKDRCREADDSSQDKNYSSFDLNDSDWRTEVPSSRRDVIVQEIRNTTRNRYSSESNDEDDD